MIDLDKLAAAVEQWGRAYTPESRAALAAVIAAAAPALIAELRQAREDVRRLRAVILRAGSTLARGASCQASSVTGGTTRAGADDHG